MAGKPARTLALSMIVRDEEKNLRRCLDSVVGLVDEMVIVDTGSTDSTKEIAASFGDKVPGDVKILDFEWCDDFAAARNFGLEHVTSDWVLQLDADEELVKTDPDFVALLKDKYVRIYQVPVVAAPGPDEIDAAVESGTLPRLFRNLPDVRFRYPIHEHVFVDDPSRYGACNMLINHFGTFTDPDKLDNRGERNLRILLGALDQYPDEVHYQYHIGMEYWNSGDWEKASKYFTQSLSGADPNDRHVPSAARNIAFHVHKSGRAREALSSLAQLESRYPDFTDLYFLEAMVRADMEDLSSAKRLLQRCVKMGDPPGRYISWGGVASWRVRELAAEIIAKEKS